MFLAKPDCSAEADRLYGKLTMLTCGRGSGSWIGGEEKESREQFDLFDLKMYSSTQTHSAKMLGRFSFSFQYRKKINSATLKVIMKRSHCSLASSKSISNGLGFGLAAQVLSWQDSTVISALPGANAWLKGD